MIKALAAFVVATIAAPLVALFIALASIPEIWKDIYQWCLK